MVIKNLLTNYSLAIWFVVVPCFFQLGCSSKTLSGNHYESPRQSEFPLDNTPSTSRQSVKYQGEEIKVYVGPGEPTQLTFPGHISGGFKRKNSHLTLDRKQADLIVFAEAELPDNGEAIIVRVENNRSYSLRILPETAQAKRDAALRIIDDSYIASSFNDTNASPKSSNYSSANTVHGLLRELILVAEFGKKTIPNYRRLNKYTGEPIISTSETFASIDQIFAGSNLWGYIVNVENLTDQTITLDLAKFRIDGTRAIQAQHNQLAPKVGADKSENKFKTKVYIVTKAKVERSRF